MPPKRKHATGGAGAGRAAKTATATKGRQSKLARENNVSAREENEIREAYSLFAEAMDGEKNGVLPIDDVKSALIALGIPPSSPAELVEFISILDPDGDGYATYEPFFAVAALKFHHHRHDDDQGRRREEEGGGGEAHRAELDEAFRLFTDTTNTNTNSDAAKNSNNNNKHKNADLITLAHLRRVAAVLKEDVDDELLKDMILEANGGAGVARGVMMDEFDGVMRRAGVWR